MIWDCYVCSGDLAAGGPVTRNYGTEVRALASLCGPRRKESGVMAFAMTPDLQGRNLPGRNLPAVAGDVRAGEVDQVHQDSLGLIQSRIDSRNRRVRHCGRIVAVNGGRRRLRLGQHLPWVGAGSPGLSRFSSVS